MKQIFYLGLLSIVLLNLTGCSSSYNWAWYVISPTHPQGQTNLLFLLSGLADTMLLAVNSIILSILLGLIVVLPGLSKRPWARAINRTYVETLRSVPVLVMILWVYYGLPVMSGISLNTF